MLPLLDLPPIHVQPGPVPRFTGNSTILNSGYPWQRWWNYHTYFCTSSYSNSSDNWTREMTYWYLSLFLILGHIAKGNDIFVSYVYCAYSLCDTIRTSEFIYVINHYDAEAECAIQSLLKLIIQVAIHISLRANELRFSHSHTSQFWLPLADLVTWN